MKYVNKTAFVTGIIITILGGLIIDTTSLLLTGILLIWIGISIASVLSLMP